MIFTQDELETIPYEALVRFCSYIGIPVDYNDTKEDIIDLILKHYSKQEDDEVPMSVRIRRIKEINNDG